MLVCLVWSCGGKEQIQGFLQVLHQLSDISNPNSSLIHTLAFGGESMWQDMDLWVNL